MLSLIRPIRHFYIRICTIYIYRKICILEKYIYSTFCLFEIFAVNNFKKLLTKIFSVLDSHHHVHMCTYFCIKINHLSMKRDKFKVRQPRKIWGWCKFRCCPLPPLQSFPFRFRWLRLRGLGSVIRFVQMFSRSASSVSLKPSYKWCLLVRLLNIKSRC